jgi:hypothetical protein
MARSLPGVLRRVGYDAWAVRFPLSEPFPMRTSVLVLAALLLLAVAL